ncbi:MAG: hypothetical protein J3K34DRAFT_236945 [Monoraphidium minutum]|nr:MAG: hypothetical protein J3K34DRAFT_236945 [Monoraphidium minutum]
MLAHARGGGEEAERARFTRSAAPVRQRITPWRNTRRRRARSRPHREPGTAGKSARKGFRADPGLGMPRAGRLAPSSTVAVASTPGSALAASRAAPAAIHPGPTDCIHSVRAPWGRTCSWCGRALRLGALPPRPPLQAPLRPWLTTMEQYFLAFRAWTGLRCAACDDTP